MTVTNARARAETLLAAKPTARVGLATDVESKPGTVAIGIALRGVGSVLIAVDAQ